MQDTITNTLTDAYKCHLRFNCDTNKAIWRTEKVELLAFFGLNIVMGGLP